MAADCIKRLKEECAGAQVKRLTKVTITLQLKSLTFQEEKSKVGTGKNMAASGVEEQALSCPFASLVPIHP